MSGVERFVLTCLAACVLGLLVALFFVGQESDRLKAQCVAERGAGKEYECVALMRGCGSSTFIAPVVVGGRR